jgi:hypothetical protein
LTKLIIIDVDIRITHGKIQAMHGL